MQRRTLRIRPAAPTIYLIDECHHHDPSTDDNIKTAIALFRDGVALAGVEGYEGGRKYDVHEQNYGLPLPDATPSEETLIGAYPRFAKALLAEGLSVVGVDCAGLSDELEARRSRNSERTPTRSPHSVCARFILCERSLRTQCVGTFVATFF